MSQGRAPTVADVIDWRLANSVAKMVASTTPAPDTSLQGLDAEVQAFAAESASLVTGYTGLDTGGGLPGPETVDRGGWAATNIGSMQSVLDPVAERVGRDMGAPPGPVRALTGAPPAVEGGALAG